MAKEDFCFTYYDGDAARDMSHMTRLERGCYTDFIISQRKFGRLTMAQIKRVLSKDFDECWPSVELVLIKDQEDKYYIQWLEDSVEKMRRQSKKQSENVSKRYNKDDSIPKEDSVLPKTDLETPLENGDGDVIGNETEFENKNDLGKSENPFVVQQMFETFKKINPKYLGNRKLDYKPLLKIHDFLAEQGNSPPDSEILEVWETIAGVVSQDNFYKQKTLSTIANCIQEITLIALHGKQSTSKNGRKPLDEDKLKKGITERYGNRQQT